MRQKFFGPASRRLLILLACCAFAFGGYRVLQRAHGGPPAPLPGEVKRRSSAAPAPEVERAPYGGPVRLAVLDGREVRESSGLAASRLNEGVFWTHNDSGDGPYLYAFDREGRARGVWRVTGAQALDWEDLAAGPGPAAGRSYLYVGDIGDNEAEREQLVVYRVAEPRVGPSDLRWERKEARETEPAEAVRLRYPDGAHDAEALLVHPKSGDLYVVTKEAGRAAGVYKLAAPFKAGAAQTLRRVAEVSVPGLFGGLVTGGDISPDGRRVVLCDYLRAYELSLPADGAGTFDAVWGRPALVVELGEREQGEAVCYTADGQSVIATSEKRPTPVIEVRRRE